MVVDIRYHLASLVAVFFALGLGILVGTSISSGGRDSQAREQWMAAIERELEALRLERKEAAALLERTANERDLYRGFAEELVTAVTEGRLTGQPAAVVLLGEDTGVLARLVSILEQAGAAVVEELRLGPDASVGDLDFFQRWGDPPPRVIAVLDGSAASYRTSLEALVRESASAGSYVTAAVVDGRGWQPILDAMDLSYVTGWDSPPGLLSLILLLSSGERGRYGYGAAKGAMAWPKHLLWPHAPASGAEGA